MFATPLETLDFKGKIGATGFEPATSRPPAVRATKLRHTPQQIVSVSYTHLTLPTKLEV